MRLEKLIGNFDLTSKSPFLEIENNQNVISKRILPYLVEISKD